MAALLDDSVLDAAEAVIDNVTTQHACSAEPATHAAIAAVSLADVAMSPADFTQGDGTPNGRTTTVAAKAGVTVDASGDAVSLAGTDGSTLIYRTDITTQTLTAGNTVNFPSWGIRFPDAVVV